MSSLKTLVMMQIKDKLDLSFFKSKKQTIFKVVFSILKFAIITALIYVAFYLLSTLRLISLMDGIPTPFFTLVFGLMFLLSICVCSFGLTKSLYLSKDNQVLLTMPTQKLTVFSSKLIVYYIYEFVRNLTYILPLLVAYALINSLTIWFYIYLIPALLIITFVTVGIGTLLSIPLVYISFFAKRYKVFEYIFIVSLISVVVFLLIKVINLIPDNFDLVGSWGTLFWDIQDFFNNFILDFRFLYYITIAFVGIRYGTANIIFNAEQICSLLSLVGIAICVFALAFLIVRPLFLSMASKPFEYTKKITNKKQKSQKHSPFWGAIKKEMFITYRNNEKFNTLVILCFMMPILILLMNKIFAAMDTRLSGTYMTIAFNVLLILLISLSSNAVMSKIYSEEGMTGYLNKTTPSNYAKILFTKLFLNLVCINLSIIASIVIFAEFSNYNVLNTVLCIIALCSIFSGHLFWSTTLDIMNPQREQYATTGTHVNNPNETKSTLMAFLVSAIFAFIVYFLISENANVMWYKICGIAIVYLIWNVFMYLSKIKVYYKEK